MKFSTKDYQNLKTELKKVLDKHNITAQDWLTNLKEFSKTRVCFEIFWLTDFWRSEYRVLNTWDFDYSDNHIETAVYKALNDLKG